jgi:hypothetical protein
MPKLINYGKKDMHKETALITIFMLSITIFFIFYSNVLQDVPALGSVVSSNYLSDEMLALFRTLCAILSLVTLLWVVLDPKGSPDYPLYYEERINRKRHSSGITRLAAFTMWHFGLFGMSFAISAIASWIHISGNEVPTWMLISSPALFATSYSCAILVTFVVSFHIIDNELARGNNIDHLFYWYEIVMHNLNVIILGAALIINNMEIDWRYFSLPIIFGITYVFWARLYVILAGVYIYNFLDPRLKGAPLIHTILLIFLTFAFVIVMFFEKLVNWNIYIGSLFIILFTCSIIKIKQPEYINDMLH